MLKELRLGIFLDTLIAVGSDFKARRAQTLATQIRTQIQLRKSSVTTLVRPQRLLADRKGRTK